MAASILIADDEEEIRAELGDYLSRKGYETMAAGDGHEALEKFEAAPPDLVITDLTMPRLDGYELIRRLRAIDADLPIIAVTGTYATADLERAAQLGATTVVTKPLRLRELAREIERLLAPADA